MTQNNLCTVDTGWAIIAGYVLGYEQVLIQGLLRQFAPWLFAAAVGFGGLWLTACWWESAGEYLLRPRG
jgi:hypothetical protein